MGKEKTANMTAIENKLDAINKSLSFLIWLQVSQSKYSSNETLEGYEKYKAEIKDIESKTAI